MGQNHYAWREDKVGPEVHQDKVWFVGTNKREMKNFVQVLLPGRIRGAFRGNCKPYPFLVRNHRLHIDFSKVACSKSSLPKECDAKHGPPHMGEGGGETYFHLPNRVSFRLNDMYFNLIASDNLFSGTTV